LTIHTGRELGRALQHKDHGIPTCLSAVFQDAIRKKAFVSDKDFRNSPISIYKRSWVPSAKDVLHWGWRMLTGSDDSDNLPVDTFVVVQNVEAAAVETLKQFHTQSLMSTADRVLSRSAFARRFARVLNSTVSIPPDDLDLLLIHLARDRQALSFNQQVVKFKTEKDEIPAPITNEDIALADLRDSMDRVNAQISLLHAKVVTLDRVAREAVHEKHMVRAKTALRSKKLAESALSHRAALALQLEEAYLNLQQAADQVDIVEAMKAGADAMNVLNQKVGGVEGVQSVMDSIHEQTATVEEITSIINEASGPVDESAIDDEFKALENVEKERKEQDEAASTAARLADLAELDLVRNDSQLQQEEERVKDTREENRVTEMSPDLSELSVQSEGEEGGKLVTA
jgi:charged multivesicular body protein 7